MSEAPAQRRQSCTMQFDSMEPTILTGSEVISDVAHYSSHAPKRWDVVVFSLPGGGGQFIKRIVGLPGETIHLTSEGLKVNGTVISAPSKELNDCFSSFRHHPDHKYGFGEFKIPADSVFLLGDNPSVYVADSREFGPIPIRNLEARVFASVHITLM